MSDCQSPPPLSTRPASSGNQNMPSRKTPLNAHKRKSSRIGLETELASFVPLLSSKAVAWTERTQALKRIAEIVALFAKTSTFEASSVAALIEPLQHAFTVQLSDLRSAVIKQACETLRLLGKHLGTHLASVAFACFPILLRLSRNSKRAMAMPAQSAMQSLVGDVPCEGTFDFLCRSVLASKSDMVRLRCIELMAMICDDAQHSAAYDPDTHLWADLAGPPPLLHASFEEALRVCIPKLCRDSCKAVRQKSRALVASLWHTHREFSSEIFGQLAPKIRKVIAQEHDEFEFAAMDSCSDTASTCSTASSRSEPPPWKRHKRRGKLKKKRRDLQPLLVRRNSNPSIGTPPRVPRSRSEVKSTPPILTIDSSNAVDMSPIASPCSPRGGSPSPMPKSPMHSDVAQALTPTTAAHTNPLLFSVPSRSVLSHRRLSSSCSSQDWSDALQPDHTTKPAKPTSDTPLQDDTTAPTQPSNRSTVYAPPPSQAVLGPALVRCLLLGVLLASLVASWSLFDGTRIRLRTN